MQQTFTALFIFVFVAAFSSVQADTVRILKDPSECEDGENGNACRKCGCRYYWCECNPYKRSVVDNDDIDPVPSWPAYWDQPLQEELTR